MKSFAVQTKPGCDSAFVLSCSLLVALTAALVFATPSLAVPAAEEIYEILQPDGKVFAALTRGDEWTNWIETTGGYAVAQGSDDFWYYVSSYHQGRPVLSSVRADLAPPASIRRGVRPAASPYARSDTGEEALSRAPVGAFTGPVLFILTEFNDQAGSTAEASWAAFIASNIADFFDEGSHGKVQLQQAQESSGTANNGVVNWVNVGYDHPDTDSTTGTANRQLTRDAILAADPFVNFSSYDDNNDNYVDADELAVVIIVAGYERAFSSAYSPSVWGHKWSVGGSVTPPVVDGVTVGAYHSGAGGYAQFGELHRSSAANQHQATMGIMVHELGHLIFGLPDLYDTDYSSSGIGAFGVMGGGSWGKAPADTYAGETPVLPSAWTKTDRGWATANLGNGTETILASGSAAATSSNTVFKLATSLTNEFFLVENRQPQGYDAGLDRWLGNFGGLAIWHIDDNVATNSDDSHRKVDVEEADGSQMGTSSGEATDLWYSGNATTFDAGSTPDSDLYSGTPSGVSVTNVSASGTNMTADMNDTAGSGQTFTIFNDGDATLSVASIQLNSPAAWIGWSPDAPFDVGAGASEAVEVTVDLDLAPAGQTVRRLLVYSNDPNESPYPGGVDIVTDKPGCHALSRTHTGSGSNPSASPPNSVGCPAGEYMSGESIQLLAVPTSGWLVSGWSGTVADTSTSTQNTANMPNSSHSVTVHYIEDSGGIPDHLLLENLLIDSTETHQACVSITVRNVEIGSGGHALLRSPQVSLEDNSVVQPLGELVLDNDLPAGC